MDTPIEAGLGFAVKLDKPEGFIGRDVLAKQKSQGIPNKRLLQFRMVDPELMLFHVEVIWRDDEIVGYIRVGGYGHTLGASIGLGMVEAKEPVKKAWVEAGKWEIELAGVRHPAIASVSPMYDPKRERVKS